MDTLFDTKASSPPGAVVRALGAANLSAEEGAFALLSGGRTNRLWRFRSGGKNLVCKLYSGSSSPLFANDPDAEFSVLALASTVGLAPKPVARLTSDAGPLVVYAYQKGIAWAGDFRSAGRALAKIHQIPAPNWTAPPSIGLRVTQDVERMLHDLGIEDEKTLTRFSPRVPKTFPTPNNCLLHGDPVPANMVQTDHGLLFVDWQCPRLGEAAEDIALFLSPAMQSLYGGKAPTIECETQFFEGYANSDVEERYRTLAPFLHWRIAAHCLWRAVQGSPDYAPAAQLEVALLGRTK